jgi:UDP-3-O-[3-hydroxymyristoyl] glucosamine N-acyltransferase
VASSPSAASHGIDAIERVLGAMILEVEGDRTRTFTRPMPVSTAEPDALTFVRKGHPSAYDLASSTRAACVLCGPELRERFGGAAGDRATRVYVDNPRLAFARVGRALFAPKLGPGIHPTAVVHPEAEIDASVHVGAGSYVGRARIEAGTQIWPHVTVLDDVVIGKNVVVRSGSVIGTDGFGYEQNDEGAWEHLPHVGRVVIEDDVELGANVSIARGTMGDTVLRRGVKVDNLVHIAHNVEIGEDTLVIATAHVSGSARIGARTWVAPGAAVSDGVRVGDDVTVGLGAVVMKDVPDRAKVMGQPASLLPERFWNPGFGSKRSG